MPLRAPVPSIVRSLLVPGLILAGPVWAEELPGDPSSKHGYHLFRPTPAALLRDMSTDRPDLTESPYSVDAGHAQLELEAGHFDKDDTPGLEVKALGAMSANLKLGLLPSVDVQIGCFGWSRESETAVNAPTVKESGIGDTFLRVKWNLWGNDGGSTAFAVMPFVTFPSGSDDVGSPSTDPGLILPFAWAWPAGLGFGAMGQVNWMTDSDGDGRHAEWVTTATVGRDVAGPVGAFAEFAATTRPRREGGWIGTVDLGVTVAATPNVQLDGGAILGVTEAAEGLGLFLGLSIRR